MGGQAVASERSTQQAFTPQYAATGQLCVAWQFCAQLPLEVWQVSGEPVQIALSGQSLFEAHWGRQRGCAGVAVLQLWPSGQSVGSVQPALQLIESSGLAVQIWPFEQSASAVQVCRRKQALSRQA